MKKTFTFEIDTGRLPSVSDEYLAALWSLAQFLPVEHGDKDACEIVRAISVEIVLRWMRNQPVPVFNVQPDDFLRKQIQRVARWNGSEWVAVQGHATSGTQPEGA